MYATTFLFTDIEGSTERWNQDPVSMRHNLVNHDHILRSAIEGRGGWVFKTVGDAFCAAFSDPVGAADCAIAVQQALAAAEWRGEAIRVRMGLHTGVAEEREGDFFGPAVNKTARICSIGAGGQVLVSEATRTLASGERATGMNFVDLGPRMLKGFEVPVRIYQVVACGLETEFPPLRAPSPGRTNLPEELTSFIGRGKEIEEVGWLLSASRLVTLTGPGGVGKTRLALRLAASCGDRYGNGRWLVELASLTEADDVPSAVCRTLGLKQSSGSNPLEHLVEYLSNGAVLVVLDNCEHLVEACAGLAERLLRSCPGLSLLATSREPLGIPGEAAYRVPPLASGEQGADGSSLLAFDAIRLFVERARSARPDFAVSDAEASLVARICAQLDGIPLALELAAAKVRYYALPDLASMLADQFSFLASGSRTALPRQRTLRALIDWSWDLLDEAERRVLARLSVFRAPFDLADATAVIGVGCTPILERLIFKSLVSLEAREGGSLYSILETLREYAAERLRKSGEEAATYGALAERCVEFLAETRKKLRGPGFGEAMRDFVLRTPTLDTCLDRCIAEGDPRSLTIAGISGLIRLLRGDYARVLQQCEGALSCVPGADQTPQAVDALEAACRVKTLILIDLEGAFTLADKAEKAACGDDILLARALRLKGMVIKNARVPMGQGSAFARGLDVKDAERYCREALDLSRRIGDPEGIGEALADLAAALRMSGDLDNAVTMYEEALSMFRASGDPLGIARVFWGLPYTFLRNRELDKARKTAVAGLDAAVLVNHQDAMAMMRYVIGAVALTRLDVEAGALEEAERAFRLILDTGRGIGSYYQTRLGIINLGPVIALMGRAEECEELVRDRVAEIRCRGSHPEANKILRQAAFCLRARGETELSAFCFGALAPSSMRDRDPGDEAIDQRLERELRGILGDERYEAEYEKGVREGLATALAMLDGRFPGCAALAASIAGG